MGGGFSGRNIQESTVKLERQNIKQTLKHNPPPPPIFLIFIKKNKGGGIQWSLSKNRKTTKQSLLFITQ